MCRFQIYKVILTTFSLIILRPYQLFYTYIKREKKEKRFVFDLARGDLGDMESA
jgi:hypothetical protein